MTKDEINKIITDLDLDKDMEKALLKMVADSEEVSYELLEALADILEDQAALDEDAAGYYTAAADELDLLAAKVDGIRDDYRLEKEEMSAKLTELLSDDLTAAVDKVNHHVSLGAGAAM